MNKEGYSNLSKNLGFISIILYVLPVLFMVINRFVSIFYWIPYVVWTIIMWLQLVAAIAALIIGLIVILGGQRDNQVAILGIIFGGIGVVLWALSFFWHVGLGRLMYFLL